MAQTMEILGPSWSVKIFGYLGQDGFASHGLPSGGQLSVTARFLAHGGALTPRGS